MVVQLSTGTSRTGKLVLLLLCCLFASSLALASGSGGGSSGGGGGSSGGGSAGGASGGGSGGGSSGGGSTGGGGGGGDGYVIHVSKASYDRGKKIFFEQVVCESCPYAELKQTSEGVRAVWSKLKKDLHRKGVIGANLKGKERRSVKAFIRKRFNL